MRRDNVASTSIRRHLAPFAKWDVLWQIISMFQLKIFTTKGKTVKKMLEIVSICLTGASMITGIVGTAIPYWVHGKIQSIPFHSGLWKTCATALGQTQCVSFPYGKCFFLPMRQSLFYFKRRWKILSYPWAGTAHMRR